MSDPLTGRDGALALESVKLETLAREHGTPCYAYSRASIVGAYRALENAFAPHPHRICYAVKANGNLSVLAELARLGAGFDIVSGGELARVCAAGGESSRVVFSGVGKTDEEIEAALDAEIACFNVESHAELARIEALASRRGTRAPVALRVNPDIDARTHPHITTGRAADKFGVDAGAIVPLARRASQSRSLSLEGLACHVGSQITASEVFAQTAARMAELEQGLRREGIRLAHIDLGGGLGIDYAGNEATPFAAYARALMAPFAGSTTELVIEPGRALVGRAGILLTRVLYTKTEGGRSMAIVDAGMNDLLRPALYGASHRIVPIVARTKAGTVPWSVVGPVCESADQLGVVVADELKAGELLAVLDVGAYGFVMSSNYNARPRPPELWIDGAQVHVARARESRADLFAAERLVSGR